MLLVGRGGGVRVGVGRAPEVVLPPLPLPAATCARPVVLALAVGDDPYDLCRPVDLRALATVVEA